MTSFVQEMLGLEPVTVEWGEADLFRLPDGSQFAVSAPGGMGDTERSLGFLVDHLDSAVEELLSVGVEVGEVHVNGSDRYAHFWAPDGNLYELVERLEPQD